VIDPMHLKRSSRYAEAVYGLQDLRAASFPEPDYLIDGVLSFGSATIFTGREKSGKSLMLLYLAWCVATGTPFLGNAVREGPVLLIALEDSPTVIRSRLQRIDGGRGDYPFHYVRLDGSLEDLEFQVEHERDVQGLYDLVRELEPVLLIVDPLREAHSGRENDSDDMSPRIRPFRQLAHQTNTTVLITHHAGKMSGSFRGSTAIRAAFDDEILWVREDEETDHDIRGSLRIEGRNLPKRTIRTALDPDTFHWSLTSSVEAVSDPSVRDKIEAYLHTADEPKTAEQIATAINSPKNTVQSRISDMLNERPSSIVAIGKARKGQPRRFMPRQQGLRNVVHIDSVNDSVNRERSEGGE
jgi:hypothetical protein